MEEKIDYLHKVEIRSARLAELIRLKAPFSLLETEFQMLTDAFNALREEREATLNRNLIE